MVNILFFYDIGSLYSYFAFEMISRHLAGPWRGKATVILRPTLVGGIFKSTGNDMPAALPAKAAHLPVDASRLATLLSIKVRIPDFFPMDSLKVMRVSSALVDNRPDAMWDTTALLFGAYWGRNLDLSKDSVLESTLLEHFDNQDQVALMQWSNQAHAKQTLKDTTKEAVSFGAYGVPAFVLPSSQVKNGWPTSPSGHELFFGCDRLFLLARMAGLPWDERLFNHTTSKL